MLVMMMMATCLLQGDKSVSPSVKSPLNNSGAGASGSVTPSSAASIKGFSKSALPPSLGVHSKLLINYSQHCVTLYVLILACVVLTMGCRTSGIRRSELPNLTDSICGTFGGVAHQLSDHAFFNHKKNLRALVELHVLA